MLMTESTIILEVSFNQVSIYLSVIIFTNGMPCRVFYIVIVLFTRFSFVALSDSLYASGVQYHQHFGYAGGPADSPCMSSSPFRRKCLSPQCNVSF